MCVRTQGFTPLRSIQTGEFGCYEMSFSGDGTVLGVAGMDEVQVFDTYSGLKLAELGPGSGMHVAISPDGRWLATTGANGFQIWQLPPREQLVMGARLRSLLPRP